MPWFTGWASPWLAVGRHHDGSPWSARTTVLGLQPADDPHFYYLDNTGTLFFGPCGPGGGPYGRREHGRFRRSAGRNPRDGKGVKAAWHRPPGCTGMPHTQRYSLRSAPRTSLTLKHAVLKRRSTYFGSKLLLVN